MRRFIVLVVLVTAFPTIGLATANRSGRIQDVGRLLSQVPAPKPHPIPTVSPFLNKGTTKSIFEGETYKRVAKKVDAHSTTVAASAGWGAYLSTNLSEEKLTEKFTTVGFTESYAVELAKKAKKLPKPGKAAFFATGVAGTVATAYQHLTEDENPVHKYQVFGGILVAAFIFYLVVGKTDRVQS